jgi:MoxR-like ATPase
MGILVESIDQGYWVVVDELNRADLDKAFGEMFTLLSGKRATLPFKDKENRRFVILPPGEAADVEEHPVRLQQDWRMIGTMNTFDKASLFQLSFAFMRRFAFVDVAPPEREDFRSLLDTAWPEEPPGDELTTWKDILAGRWGAG